MKYSIYNHCAGKNAVREVIRNEVAKVIESVTIKPAKGTAPRIRDAILDGLRVAGWSSKVPVAPSSDMTITAMLSDVGLCLQTGNMARMYADLIKLQTLYLDGCIKSAIVIVPSEPVALHMGSNIAQAQRLERELRIFKKAYYVPTVVFALE